LTNELGAESVAGLVDLASASEPAAAPLLKPRSRARWGWTVGVAAAVLVAVASTVAVVSVLRDRSIEFAKNPVQDPPAAAAQIVEQHGLELLNAQGEATIAVVGDDVQPGQTLRTTGDEGFAVLKSTGKARVEMQGDTTARLIVGPAAEGEGYFLSQGVLRVAAVRKDGPMLTVTTPHAAIQADGTFLCSTTADATYVEVEAGSVRLVRQADGQGVDVTDGFSAVAAAADIEPLMTRAVAPTLTAPLHVLKKIGARQLAFSADSARLTTAEAGGWRIWDPKSGLLKATHRMPLPEFGNGVLSRDARFLAGSSKGALAQLIDLGTGQPVFSLPLGGKEIRTVGVAADGSALATAEPLDRNRFLVRLFDGVTGAPRRTVRIATHGVRTLGFSADASRLAIGAQKGTVYVVDTATDKEPTAFQELAPGVAAVLFAPDGRHLAAVGTAGSVVVWNVATRTETYRFQISGRSFLSLAYSPGGRFLAAGTRDGTITLWNTETGAEQLTLKAHSGVRALAFSPDGRWLAAATPRPTFIWRMPDQAIDPQK